MIWSADNSAFYYKYVLVRLFIIIVTSLFGGEKNNLFYQFAN